MGTRKMDHRRSRRARVRGSAPFVAFALLFALALAQGGSIVAFASGSFTQDSSATATKGDDSASKATSKDRASDEAATRSVDSDDGASATGSEDAGEATSSDGEEAAAGTGSSVDVAAAPEPDEPGAPSGNGVQPTLLEGNRNCAEILGGDLLFEFRLDPPETTSIDLDAESGGLVDGTLEVTVHGDTFDFEIVDGDPLAAVVVKGGSNANLFDYRPDGETADTDLHAPVNADNGQFYGLSHISFCWAETEEVPVPAIEITKSCPAAVPVGEAIEYTITIENTGEEALVDVDVDDSLLGNITDDFDVDLSQPFDEGATATAQVTYSPGATEDPVENTVTVTATGAESDSDVSDDDSCTTDVTHAPGIDVSKTCPTAADEGDTITYTITVTNTGDEDLENVIVTDSILGDLAEFSSTLVLGASETFDYDYTVPEGGDDPLVNVVTASGSGVDSGDSVSSTATCTTNIRTTVVLPTVTTSPTVGPTSVPPTTPFTGSDAGRLGLISLLIFGIGLTLVAATRRWRSSDSA